MQVRLVTVCWCIRPLFGSDECPAGTTAKADRRAGAALSNAVLLHRPPEHSHSRLRRSVSSVSPTARIKVRSPAAISHEARAAGRSAHGPLWPVGEDAGVGPPGTAVARSVAVADVRAVDSSLVINRVAVGNRASGSGVVGVEVGGTGVSAAPAETTAVGVVWDAGAVGAGSRGVGETEVSVGGGRGVSGGSSGRLVGVGAGGLFVMAGEGTAVESGDDVVAGSRDGVRVGTVCRRGSWSGVAQAAPFSRATAIRQAANRTGIALLPVPHK